MNKLKFLLVVLPSLLLSACEYEPVGENFIDLTPPDNSIPVTILLNNISPCDTIYIYKNTTISLENSSSKELVKAVASFDGNEFATIYDSYLNININPTQLDEGIHELTIDVIFTSGTGSLGELMGMEGYEGEMYWKIYIIHNPQDQFEIGRRVNEDGFLEIFWDNTILPEKNIKKYTIFSPYNHTDTTTINDPSQKLFVDSGYVCGTVQYNVTTYMKDGNSITKSYYFNEPSPTLYYEELGVHNLRVHWDKPYANGRFCLKEGGNIIEEDFNDTTITIPQLFGVTYVFSLETRPRNSHYDHSNNHFITWGQYSQGTSLNLPNFPLYAYNSTENIIYTSKYNNLVAFDATTLQEINTISIIGNPLGLLYGGKVASAPHNSTVAAMTGEETWIFTDSRFINPIIIPQLPGSIQTRLAALTSNDRFFVVNGNSNICKVFNTLTGDSIFSFTFTYNTICNFPDYASVSEDGHYFCASSENGIEVFEINGTATNILYTDNRYYKGAMFMPSQTDKLLLRVGSNIEIRQLPGFSLIQTLDVSANSALLCNIDPVSLSLLYHQNDSLKVCNVNNLAETIFEIRSNEYTCKMINNKLLTRSGMCFDISPYLNKK